MSTWIIEPREPLIVRDGRPFQRQPGVIAASLPFPFPSTTAGAARTRAGSKDGLFVAGSDLSTLKDFQIRGPLPVEYNEREEWELLVPAPGDALLLEREKRLHCKRLVPLKPADDAYIQPFRGENSYGYHLSPVGSPSYDPAKPAGRRPAFWRWSQFQHWLSRPEQMDEQIFAGDDLGIQALLLEQRLHVSLERGMMVAQEGALFETRGLEFTASTDERLKKLSDAHRLALWLDVEAPDTYPIEAGLDTLGAERRLVSWQKSPENLLESIRTCPDDLREQIAETRACRLILLTPAYFQQGYLPDVAHLEYAGIKPALRAVLISRPQVVSGWDIEKHSIKPARRLAPAGSVFFLNLGQSGNIHAWIEHIWMSCISEERQACRDGFGLAALGTWNGALEEVSAKEVYQ
ncbi:MAG TPA: type III-B CRISPR module-associated protein Cmr3 [Ktedonobacteraceae bacterium]|nr:type III-B CRISPR module-associated protein Cmr3 [Ktedonobacteraceae bacterium]